jgi:undecaprenyl-diphosphatase
LAAAAFIAFGFVAHLLYLTINCPIDLSGDEAHYWDWSRQLDLSYYSKGPAVAYIMRASCAIFGDVMWAVRLPALLFAAAISVITYVLTLRIFQSDRLALGATLLLAAVPMFIAGSVMMTIDPPMMTMWALATLLATLAIIDNRPNLWPVVALAIGLGALAKYGILLWFVGLAVFMILDRASRVHLRSLAFWTMPLVVLVCLLPPIIWNAQHDWVSLKHVSAQTVAGESKALINPLHTLEMLAGQFGVVGPVLFVFMMLACIDAWRLARQDRADRRARAMLLLLAIGVGFFVTVLLGSLRTKIQPNWPAPAYFSLLILTAWWIGRQWNDSLAWRRTRGWFWVGVVGLAAVATPLLHRMQVLYPIIPVEPRRFDPTYRLLGWQELGARIGRELQAGDAFILCQDYQVAAQTAFYTPGQPRTFCVSSYYQDPELRRRLSQYDIWPDRRLDQPSLVGRDAIFIGWPNDELRAAFEHFEALPTEEIVRNGVRVRAFLLHRGTGFKGMTRPTDGHRH